MIRFLNDLRRNHTGSAPALIIILIVFATTGFIFAYYSSVQNYLSSQNLEFETEAASCANNCPVKINKEQCAKVKLSGATTCQQERTKSNGSKVCETWYCCRTGLKWTHYDKKCCDPNQITMVWNSGDDPNYGGYWDTACGCPGGKYCSY